MKKWKIIGFTIWILGLLFLALSLIRVVFDYYNAVNTWNNSESIQQNHNWDFSDFGKNTISARTYEFLFEIGFIILGLYILKSERESKK